MGNIIGGSNPNRGLPNKGRVFGKVNSSEGSIQYFNYKSPESTASSGSSTPRNKTGVYITGTIHFKTGSYTGSILVLGDGVKVPHGNGTITFPDNRRFKSITGNFHNGTVIGEAIVQFRTMQYIGSVDEDYEPHGRGKYEYTDSETYKRLYASFQHGHMLTAVVTIEYRSGDVFCGSIMARGMPHGSGTAFYAKTGNRYEGTFYMGKRMEGKVIDPKGTVIQKITQNMETK